MITTAEFKRKWARYSGRESAAYQEHFNDLCHILGQPTPAAADPSGNDFFCFQKRVVKDAAAEAGAAKVKKPKAQRAKHADELV